MSDGFFSSTQELCELVRNYWWLFKGSPDSQTARDWMEPRIEPIIRHLQTTSEQITWLPISTRAYAALLGCLLANTLRVFDRHDQAKTVLSYCRMIAANHPDLLEYSANCELSLCKAAVEKGEPELAVSTLSSGLARACAVSNTELLTSLLLMVARAQFIMSISLHELRRAFGNETATIDQLLQNHESEPCFGARDSTRARKQTRVLDLIALPILELLDECKQMNEPSSEAQKRGATSTANITAMAWSDLLGFGLDQLASSADPSRNSPIQSAPSASGCMALSHHHHTKAGMDGRTHSHDLNYYMLISPQLIVADVLSLQARVLMQGSHGSSELKQTIKCLLQARQIYRDHDDKCGAGEISTLLASILWQARGGEMGQRSDAATGVVEASIISNFVHAITCSQDCSLTAPASNNQRLLGQFYVQLARNNHRQGGDGAYSQSLIESALGYLEASYCGMRGINRVHGMGSARVGLADANEAIQIIQPEKAVEALERTIECLREAAACYGTIRSIPARCLAIRMKLRQINALEQKWRTAKPHDRAELENEMIALFSETERMCEELKWDPGADSRLQALAALRSRAQVIIGSFGS